MCDMGWNLAKTEGREYYDAPRKLSTYVASQYDATAAFAAITETSTVTGCVGRDAASFYDRVREMWAIARRRSGTGSARMLDVGCYVGGMTWRLAAHFDVSYGIDASFAGVATARAIQLGLPLPFREYPLYIEGNRSQTRPIEYPARGKVEFFVGNAEVLPIAPACYDLIAALNIVELVRDPRRALDEFRRAVRESGDLLLSSPYWWDDDECSVDRWLGGTNNRDSASAVREELGSRGFVIAKERDGVPWLLRYNARAYMLFLCHVVVARAHTVQG
jgi:SAM-dependent methyltransferase